MVSIVPADSGFKVTWMIKDNQIAKILSGGKYIIEKTNVTFVNAGERIDQVNILDCSENITENLEETTTTFNFSK